jgi:diaminohydroxyphosphoribosylaminopyrimidine deaminase/5-amino-6-(5-phosphoribosylamino)uracil reductase
MIPAPRATVPSRHPADDQAAWDVVVLMAAMTPALSAISGPRSFGFTAETLHSTDPSDPATIVRWVPETGWELTLDPTDPRYGLLDLWLPICSATPKMPVAVGHLGQSMDGFIATQSGDSQFVTGQQNILHLHRLRALCSAVIVGAGTVALDNPLLTTRHVEGPNPIRVIFDPGRRLEGDYRLFTDDTASTLYACARTNLQPGETQIGHAGVLPLSSDVPVVAAGELVVELQRRGCFRLFIEGGGVTVSAFLEAGLLDRLQIAIAPVLIGNGRPAIRLPGREALRDCARPDYRVFRMGGDVLFDCNLRRLAEPRGDTGATVTRIM